MPTKKKSNKKLRGQKQLHQKKKAPPPPAGSHRNNFTAVELAAAAEQAMNSGQDPWQAIALYDAAVKVMSTSTTATTATTSTPTAATVDSSYTTTTLDDDDQNKNDTTNDDTTLDLALLLEKRAEIKVSVSNPDGARQDYQEALQVLLSQPQQPRAQLHGNKADQQYQDASAAAFLERIASLHLYMGQLSQGNDALTCYRNGIQALQTSLQKRQETVVVVASVADDNLDAMAEVRHQLAAACCSAAEVYLTDLCYEDDAELQCEAYLQQALHEYSTDNDGPSTDALQTAANLRLSQCRGHEAVDYILQCYQQMKPACRALAALVGIRDDTDNDDDSKNIDEAPASAAAAVDSSSHNDNTARATRELTEIEAVQSLPGFEFRCQTAKILLECAGFLKEQLQQQQEHKDNAHDIDDDDDDAKMSSNNNDNAAALPQQQEKQRHKMILCAQAAIDVLASLLAENDEVIEIWFLMGDAYAALVPTVDKNDHQNAAKNRDDDDADSSSPDDDDDDNYVELAQHYWKKTLEMLESVKGSLEQESMESSSQEEEDDLQQQLDEILCQMDDVRCKLSEIRSSTCITGSSGTRRKASATKTMMEE